MKYLKKIKLPKVTKINFEMPKELKILGVIVAIILWAIVIVGYFYLG